MGQGSVTLLDFIRFSFVSRLKIRLVVAQGWGRAITRWEHSQSVDPHSCLPSPPWTPHHPGIAGLVAQASPSSSDGFTGPKQGHPQEVPLTPLLWLFPHLECSFPSFHLPALKGQLQTHFDFQIYSVNATLWNACYMLGIFWVLWLR